MAGIDDVNRHPVIHTWSYKPAEAQQTRESPMSCTSDRNGAMSLLKVLGPCLCLENLMHVDKLEESPKLAE
jgi:hypothetical protein